MQGEKLKEIQDICRTKATLVMDEFYSGYYYGSSCDGSTVSAAANVKGDTFSMYRLKPELTLYHRHKFRRCSHSRWIDEAIPPSWVENCGRNTHSCDIHHPKKETEQPI